MKKYIFVILLFLTTVYCFSQADLQTAATVNIIRTETITVRQLRTEVARMESATNRTLSQAERLKILDVMINERIILQAAERDRIIVTENELNQEIQRFRTSLVELLGRQPTDTEFAQAVRNESGLDVPEFREQLRKQSIVHKYLLHKKNDLINSILVPTNEEILSEYNLLKSDLVRPDTIRFLMIQIPYGPDTTSRARAKTLADNLLREIGNDPLKFDEVAKRSDALNSGYQAGDAGYLPKNQEASNVVGQTFMDVAFSLRQEQVSGLIEGRQGFQIIKVTEKYTQKNLEFNDILQLGTRITVRDYIGQLMLTQRQQNVMAQASQELISELRTNRTFQIFENNIRW